MRQGAKVSAARPTPLAQPLAPWRLGGNSSFRLSDDLGRSSEDLERGRERSELCSEDLERSRERLERSREDLERSLRELNNGKKST